MRPDKLRDLSRDELIERATALGVVRPSALTRTEIIDAINARDVSSQRPPLKQGWLGRARDLVARVVERGLHLPDAAKMLRTMPTSDEPQPPPPLPTVTLAEIYAAQGYYAKAVTVLDEVLARESNHADARTLRERFFAELSDAERESFASVEQTVSAVSKTAKEPSAEVAATADPLPEQVSPEAPSARDAAAVKPSLDAAPAEGATDRLSAEAAELTDQPPAEDEANAPVVDPSAAGDPPPDPAATTESAVEKQGASPPPQAKLPERYERDEVVALATDPTTAFVYWELRPVSFARARWRDPSGRLMLRVLCVRSGETQTESSTLDIEVSQLAGERFVRGLAPGSELRLCVGWLGPRGFAPLAVGQEMAMPRNYRAKTGATRTIDAGGAAALRANRDRPPPRPAALERTASRKLRSYLAQVAAERPLPLTEFEQLPPADGTTLGSASYGGASELYGGQRPPRGGVGELHGAADLLYGGASDLYGGASDLYGGASDLYGGASDLYRTEGGDQ